MSQFLEAVQPRARDEDVPDAFRSIVRAGWTTDGDAQLLAALRSGYSGGGRTEFDDAIHYEATVNGRGMMDYDLPTSGPERLEELLRRSLGYVCTGLLAVPPTLPWPMLGYVSLAAGGLEDDVLTAHVTFCSRRPDQLPYVGDVDAYTHEALLEVSQEEAVTLLGNGR